MDRAFLVSRPALLRLPDQCVIPDETGVLADNLGQASEEALAVILEMRASGEITDSDTHWELVIRDEDGTELKRIPV